MPLPARLPSALVNILYLHGFASSPKSTKVGYFTERFREHHVDVRCPDFNQPDFTTMTLTRMLDQLAGELSRNGARPATLIGSSLGGTVAILAAAKFAARVERLVLMAPAVMFAKAGHHLLPPERIEEWHRRGALPFFHYADQKERALNFAFYEDSLRYDAFATVFQQPTLIFQGLRDQSVDHRTVEAFARTRPNVTLSLLDDDHQLLASLPRMWTDIRHFVGFDV